MLVIFHQPTRGLRTKPDATAKDEGWKKGRAQLQAPSDSPSWQDDYIRAESEEDADHDPQLPEHDQCTTYAVRSHLSRIDRDSSVLCAYSDPHHKTRSEQSLPALSESRSDRSSGQTQSSNEDLASPSEVVIQWIDNKRPDKTSCQEDDSVNDTKDPFVFRDIVRIEAEFSR